MARTKKPTALMAASIAAGKVIFALFLLALGIGIAEWDVRSMDSPAHGPASQSSTGTSRSG